MQVIHRQFIRRLIAMAAISTALLGSPVSAQAQSSISPRPAPAITGFGALVSLNQPEYWTNFMPPGVSVPEITANLVVFNNSKIPVTFRFPTSQRYDFAIKNSDGVEVWRWSRGKYFAMVLGSLTLQPGQAITIAERIKFADANGNPFPADQYTLTGGLTAHEPQSWDKWAMEGNVGFRHYYVY